MGRKIDCYFIAAAYGYLALPLMLFAFGWMKWQLSFCFAAVLVAASFLCVRSFANSSVSLALQSKRQVFLITCLVLIWVCFSGIGGFSFQNNDHHARNAVLHDLVDFSWPVIYDYSTKPSEHPFSGHQGALIYYFAYWLPAALVGKLFGWQAANIALYLWTVLGILLSFYFFFRYLGKVSLWAVVVFVFWSGMDVVGYTLWHGLPLPGTHMEWWSLVHYQYSSFTTTLYWVYNQTVTSWLIVMLILNLKDTKNTVFTYALAFPFAPFPFLGLTPFVAWHFLRGAGWDKWRQSSRQVCRNVLDNIRQGFTFQNTVAVVMVVAVFWLFFTVNASNVSDRGWIWERINPYYWGLAWLDYTLFCFLEFGLYAALLWRNMKREAYFIIAILVLLILPHYYVNVTNDFVMRVSIPALLVLMVYTTRHLLVDHSIQSRSGKYLLIALLCIGAVTPIYEIYRSVYHTAIDREHCVADSWKSFSQFYDPLVFTLYISGNYEKSVFFQYLAPGEQ